MASRSILAPVERVTPYPTYQTLGERYVCAYCCEPAETIDHTVPQWLVCGNIELILKWQFVAVYACLDCNVRAGRTVDQTFRQRRDRIHTSLFKKTAKARRVAYFDPEDLEEMGYGLRSMVSQSLGVAEVARRRLRRLAQHDLPKGIPDDLWIRAEPE